MNALKFLLCKRVPNLRKFHRSSSWRQLEAAAAVPAAEELTIPVPEGADKPVSAKIDKIAKEITALNLVEVAELSDILKKRLKLPDAPMMSFGAAAPAKEEEDDTRASQQVQTSFVVKLATYDEKQKVALIKEIKNLIPGTNLVQAKKFVETCPQVIKGDVSKEEAEKIKEAVNKVGGQVTIE